MESNKIEFSIYRIFLWFTIIFQRLDQNKEKEKVKIVFKIAYNYECTPRITAGFS